MMPCIKRTRGTLARVARPPTNEPHPSEPGAEGYSAAARRPAWKPSRTSLMILATNGSRSAGEWLVTRKLRGLAGDGQVLTILVH
jgi:hypothetical protein